LSETFDFKRLNVLLFAPGGVSALPGFLFRFKYTRGAYYLQELLMFFLTKSAAAPAAPEMEILH